jgi:hypothetical protein
MWILRDRGDLDSDEFRRDRRAGAFTTWGDADEASRFLVSLLGKPGPAARATLVAARLTAQTPRSS